MKTLALFAALTFATLLVSSAVLAHHGEVNYDTDHLVSVKGTVTDFQFINPHVQVFMDVKSDKGEIEKWSGEARSPSMLVRVGDWTKTTLKPGEGITMFGFQSKNGAKVLRLKKIVTADGREFNDL